MTLAELPGAGETVTGGSCSFCLGGKGANQAVAAARAGAEIAYRPMLLGGVLAWMINRRPKMEAEAAQKTGVLIASGIIAGESLVGVLLGFVAYGQELMPGVLGKGSPQLGLGLMNMLGLGESSDILLNTASLVVLGLIAVYLLTASLRAGKK